MDLCVQIGFYWTGGMDKKEDGGGLKGEMRTGRLERGRREDTEDLLSVECGFCCCFEYI